MNENRVANRHCKHLMDLGEPSTTRRCKTSPSTPNAEDPERPFKKARYVWQLKGKYHLKSSTKPQPSQQSQLNHEQHSPDCCNNSSDTDSDVENNLNEKNSVQHNILDNILVDSKQILKKNVNKKASDVEPSTYMDKSTLDDLSVVMPNNCSQDDYLEHWQASQMAKGYVDNTINSLLELWKIAPFGSDIDVMDDLENDEQVEDEGILMAIQSHGLQTGEQSMKNQTKDIDEATSSKERSFTVMSNFSDTNNIPDLTETVNTDDQFLSAAVSAAIKKKGLSSYNYG